ncbi:MAG: inositol monophosphatase family protein [Hyphomicrobiaceae bacterium]
MSKTVDIDAVSRILREVGQAEVMSRWRQLAVGDITYKAGGGSLVTVADHAAEAALERRLGELLPGSLVVGEEGVAADPLRLDLFRHTDPVWVLDPIDGTRAFAKGREDFDMMVALVVDGITVAGWIFHPVSGELYAGECGSGVMLLQADGSSSRPTRAAKFSLGQTIGIVRQDWPRTDPRRSMSEMASHFAGFVPPTSAGRNYARMLRGEADFLLNFSVHPWDHLPGLLLVSEMGFHHGRADDTPYRPADKGAALLSAPSRALWQEIRDLLVAPLMYGAAAP